MQPWKILAAIATAMCALGPSCAQGRTAAADARFEVSTVKPTPVVNDGRTHINYPPGGDFSASNVTLLQLVSWAYDMPQKRVQGAPDWMGSQRFDLQAKTGPTEDLALRAAPSDDSNRVKRAMVRAMLADRFALKLHRETQTLPALDLVPDGPSKLVKSTASGRKYSLGRSYLRGYGFTADSLAEQFSAVTGRVVVNRTGLDGAFDVSLEWSPDDGSAPDSNAPVFLRAVPEQLGLKLVPAKEPLDVLVVDSVARPEAN